MSLVKNENYENVGCFIVAKILDGGWSNATFNGKQPISAKAQQNTGFGFVKEIIYWERLLHELQAGRMEEDSAVSLLQRFLDGGWSATFNGKQSISAMAQQNTGFGFVKEIIYWERLLHELQAGRI